MSKSLNPYVKGSIISEEWEFIDPTPDICALFVQFDERFFWGALKGVVVKWSPRMTLCAGLCRYEGRSGMCSISLSEPLLKLRPRKDLVETLLHEMIHAYLFVTANNRDREGHGPEFQSHMHRINMESGTNITIYHSFHNEVRLYKQHWWKCNGPCQHRRPFYGLVKRSMNRAPGPNDTWWAQHRMSCNGTFIKIKEPENYGVKKKKSEDENSSIAKRQKVSGVKDIRNFFKSPSKSLEGSNSTVAMSSSSAGSITMAGKGKSLKTGTVATPSPSGVRSVKSNGAHGSGFSPKSALFKSPSKSLEGSNSTVEMSSSSAGSITKDGKGKSLKAGTVSNPPPSGVRSVNSKGPHGSAASPKSALFKSPSISLEGSNCSVGLSSSSAGNLTKDGTGKSSKTGTASTPSPSGVRSVNNKGPLGSGVSLKNKGSSTMVVRVPGRDKQPVGSQVNKPSPSLFVPFQGTGHVLGGAPSSFTSGGTRFTSTARGGFPASSSTPQREPAPEIIDLDCRLEIQYVTCPCCSVKIRESDINAHLDSCLDGST